MQHSKYYKIALLIFLFVIAIDQFSKLVLLAMVGDGSQITLLPFFNLVMVWNQGVSFGMFASNHEFTRWMLVVVALLITSGLVYWFWKNPGIVSAISTGMVAGGAVGNIIDRLRLGAVADFFDFHLMGYHWPAFNVADSCIFVGVVILCLEGFFLKENKQENAHNK